MSRAAPTQEVIFVHYLQEGETSTLCGKETKQYGGPRWVVPGHAKSKSVVDCEDCKNKYENQKASA